MKVAGSNPEPSVQTNPEPAAPEMPLDGGMGAEPTSDDKPFDDAPFDAGVEADEQSDPKKFIEQLTGKLGQSLRAYNESQGQPDFDLEKFAINSLLSATHTAEMTPEDQKDIINKVKKSGDDGDDTVAPEADSTQSDDLGGDEPSMDTPTDDLGGDEPVDELTEGGILSEFINTDKLAPLAGKKAFSRNEMLMVLQMIYNSVDISGQYRIMEVFKALGYPFGENYIRESEYKPTSGSTAYPFRYDNESGDMDNLFLTNVPKSNLFQPGNEITEGCWKGYKQVGMKEKGDKTVPNCVPIKENEGESQNYMFWQNLKTINHASGELLDMDQQQIDKMVENGHAWAVDHISTASDDIEEVYHFFEANLNGLKVSDKNLQNEGNVSIFNKKSIRKKLIETFKEDDSMIEPQVAPKPDVAPSVAPSPSITPKRKNQPFLPIPDVQPDPKAKI